MDLYKFSPNRVFEKAADRICGIYNRIYGIDKGDFDENVPLLTREDWAKNHRAGACYALMGLGMGGTMIASGLAGFLEFVNLVGNFGDMGEMMKHLGGEISYISLMGLSSKLTKNSVANIESLVSRRENESTVPESNLSS